MAVPPPPGEIPRLNNLVYATTQSIVDHEVSPTARALLSLPGLRPGIQEILR